MTPPAADPFNLERFVAAQAGVYETALAELTRGRKTSHWMWFIFPQIAGLGSSPTAVRYAIGSADEARAYLEHPVLGERLKVCAAATLDGPESDPYAVFGSPDDMKFRSSLTLFDAVSPQDVFVANLDRFFAGVRDLRTLQLLTARP